MAAKNLEWRVAARGTCSEFSAVKANRNQLADTQHI